MFKKFIHSKFCTLNSRAGFTLAEILVAIGIFGVVISIAVGGFVRALRTQRQVVALISANSNASLAIEQIAREIRTGINFRTVGGNCGSGELTFENADKEEVTYSLNGDSIERGIFGAAAETITGQNVSIKYLLFCVAGNFQNDGYPPRITISLGVSPKAPGVENNVTNIETTISAREIDT